MAERIAGNGLLSRGNLELLERTFDRIWPVEEAPKFGELLRAIDEADQRLRQPRGRER